MLTSPIIQYMKFVKKTEFMKKKNLRLILTSVLLGGSVVLTSCKKEDTTPISTPTTVETAKTGEKTITGIVTKDVTWYSDTIYYLDGKVFVQSGVTLTIQPGTIIKGKEGTGTLASALIITQGGKINANGTIDKPIIFTSELDSIKQGQTIGNNLNKKANKYWGGLVILGNAPISALNGDTKAQIEGIPASDLKGTYGVNSINDNSGILKYVSIRHSGIEIAAGNELNGLTLGGVGNGTTIENIEIYATGDDGVELFGGSVNCKNILVYSQGDDGIDIDQSYSGTIEGFMVVNTDGIGTDKGLEIDGPENNSNTEGKFTLINGICKNEGIEGIAADFKAKAQGTIENVSFDYANATTKQLKIAASFDDTKNCAIKTDAYTNFLDNKLVFKNIKFKPNKITAYTSNKTCTDVSAAQTELDKIAEGTGSTFIASTFAWTCAGKRGEVK